MQKNYKPIGDYIELVDTRNTDLAVTELLGININKFFMPSVANVVGTDLSRYKLVKQNQFACNRMHVGRDYRIPIAISESKTNFIVSPAYDVFEIINTEILLPEYLMMWFKRAEFDRNAWFYTDGDVRGGLSWDDFCKIQLPVPSIEKQQEIVDEYNAVQRRITLNEKLCQKLEETAQALYRKYFVDDIDPENLPEGWRWGTIGEVADIKAGGDKPSVFSEIKTEKCQIPIFSNGLVNKGLYGFTNKAVINKKSITISARGTIGYCCLRDEPFVPIVRLIVITPFQEFYVSFLCEYLSRLDFEGSGSVQNQLTIPHLDIQEIMLPNINILQDFEVKKSIIRNQYKVIELENQKLNKLLSLLLAKMGRNK
ncbi:MAG: restriction endonuclease subunit S [Porphyromonadaceae bacterium]|nr:restriction endonuclease subunit S [Porphyromonadaceae bacterium]